MKFGRVQSTVASHAKAVRTSAILVVFALVTFLAMTGSPFASGTFAPTITFETSTTRASAHPDARITIDNSASSEDLKGMTINLPKGFWGSLAAASKCTGTAADPSNANFGNCASNTQIGSVTNEAVIDSSTARLRGQVYLADASAAGVTAAANDPAAIIIKIHPKLGAVVFKDVVLAARTQVRYGPTGVSSATDAVGPVQGINTTIDNIPTQVTDDDGHYAPVTFKLKKVQIDLKSRVENIGTTPPLLTNPGTCSAATSLDASFTSYSGPTAAASVPYQATGCSTVKFNPSASFATIPATPTAGGNAQLTSNISLPADNGSGNGSFNRIVVKLPPGISANFTALGSSGQQCPATTAVSALSSFSPTACPGSALIGSATINTPMLPDPVVGDVYLINKSPLPWLGIDVSPTATTPSPKGVIIRLVGQTTTASLLNPACGDTSCQAQVSATFNNIPDAPVKSVALSVAPPDNRAGSGLSGKLFSIAGTGDQTCLPTDDFTAAMTGNAVTAATGVVNRVSPVSVSGCAALSTTLGSGPYGGETTDTTPTFNFSDASPLQCAIDNPTPFDPGDGPSVPPTTPCTTTFTPSSPLSIGLHRFYLSGGSRPLERSFGVNAVSTADNTAPTTTIDSGPADSSTTTDTTPTFAFSSSEASSTFDCAVDDGAFLPCSTPYTTPALTTGADHTFEVRATDPAGNLDITSAKRTFTVDVAFAPSVTVSPSTTAARAHPSLDIALSNLSAQNIKDIKIAMPNGFFGGLTGVTQTCTAAQATPAASLVDGRFPATGCPAASQVGTVSTHAVVLSDDGITPSDINIDGKVFLTDGLTSGEPAGLVISVHAQVSTVDLGYINVPVHLKLRDHALGIDTLGFDLPKSITSVDGTTNFQLRDLTMHIDTGAGASHPLLTNPSSCGAAAFNSTFTGWDAGSASSSSPFQVTGCSGLPFAPQLALTLKNTAGGAPGQSDNTKRVAVDLDAGLTSNPDGAGISGATLTMPHGLTIDVQHIPPPCTADQAALDACPAASIIGRATATTPLLSDAISGNVYELKGNPGELPRVLVQLRGKINTDLVATNKFTPNSKFPQIITTFDTLPDAPLSTFSIHVGNGFLTTRPDVCDDSISEWNVIGTLGAYNGVSSPVNLPQTFDCPQAYGPIASYKLKKNRSKTTLTASVTAQTDKKLKKKLTLSLPKGLTFNKAGFTKKKLAKLVSVKVDGKKLKTTCFKKTSSTKFQITFCKKSAKAITISFKSGTLIATKKLAKKPKFKMTAVDSNNKTKTVKQVTG
jgi:hypothetical protein